MEWSPAINLIWSRSSWVDLWKNNLHLWKRLIQSWGILTDTWVIHSCTLRSASLDVRWISLHYRPVFRGVNSSDLPAGASPNPATPFIEFRTPIKKEFSIPVGWPRRRNSSHPLMILRNTCGDIIHERLDSCLVLLALSLCSRRLFTCSWNHSTGL